MELKVEHIPPRLAAFPNFNSLIDASGNDERMRPVEVDGCAEVRVRIESFAAAPVSDVPHPQRLVVTGRQHVLATRMPRQASDPVIVTKQCEEALTGRHVPDLDALVARPGGEEGSDDAGFAASVVVAAARLASLRRSSLLDGR